VGICTKKPLFWSYRGKYGRKVSGKSCAFAYESGADGIFHTIHVSINATGSESNHPWHYHYPTKGPFVAFLLAQAAAKQMKQSGRGGSIVIYASISGIRTQRSAPNVHHCWGAYNASKAATHQLTRTFATEVAKDKIRCNSISPGQFKTP
jgi:NAD(P)-dependent dehydrogenase (short-subunit alcohol dehydrogenase family)